MLIVSYPSGPCVPFSLESKCSLPMLATIGGDGSFQLGYRYCPAKGWHGRYGPSGRTLHSVKFKGFRLSVTSRHTSKVGSISKDSDRISSNDGDEGRECLWTHMHRLGNGAAGILGIALLILSNGELGGYASAASGHREETMVVVDGKSPENSQFENHGSKHQRSLQLDTKPAIEFGNAYNNSRHQIHYLLDSLPAREFRPGVLLRSKKASISSHLEARPLSIGRRGDLDEGFGESMALDYGQFVQGRDDMTERRNMFTKDAWLGMIRLKRYKELLEEVEAEEKLCVECTRNRRLLEQIWQTVSNEYYDQFGSFSQANWSGKLYESLSKAGGLLRSRAQTYTIIKEMVGSLGDPYSAFLGPSQYRIAIRRPNPSEIKYLAFQYTGVGIELRKGDSGGGLTVVAPFAGSPAEEAGILAGDRLLRVNDTPMDFVPVDEAVALLRGPIGSMVELELASSQLGSPTRKVLLERRALPLPPLRMKLVDSGDGQVLAYLRLHYFTHEGTKKMAAAIREGEALGVDGYILDLRNNPGGVFEEAIAMAALWLDCNGCDVAETIRTSDIDLEDLVYSVNSLPEEIFRRNPGTLTHAPLAIITNRSSASASEVLTGALHDNERAITVGEKTFGKGVVQYFFPMDDGSGLKLTVAKYLTPSRYDITKKGGLMPDMACHDYPHEKGQSDKCIEEAIKMLSSLRKERPNSPPPAPMQYRWLPLNERSMWASGFY
ncbi:unnamed protein product [Calypogeia fissa]